MKKITKPSKLVKNEKHSSDILRTTTTVLQYGIVRKDKKEKEKNIFLIIFK